jgi:DNA-3-methyladenine glycosylase
MPHADAVPKTRNRPFAFEPLSRSFFEPTADVVAPRLLGHWLVRRTPRGLCGGVIVETEAYLQNDPSCHAFNGETPRNRAMYGPPGHAYVYFIYGNHHCVNAVCQPAGCGEAVLIRAIEPALGEDVMRALRPVRSLHELTNGPGKLCAALAIDRQLDGVDLCDASSPLFIVEGPDRKGLVARLGPVTASTRIGISRATDLPLRFCLGGSGFVSRRSMK